MRVLVVTWDGGSNRQPFEVLCRALIDRNADVHVMSHEPHRRVFEAAGATFAALPVGDRSGERPSSTEELERVMGIWLSPAIADMVAGVLDGAGADVALVDVSLMTAFAGCEVSATPYVVVHHTLPGATWGGPRRPRFEAFVDPVNEVRARLGLPAVDDFGELMRAAKAHVVPTVAELDGPVPWELPLRYVGPLQPDNDPSPVPDLPEGFALVSFSTTWQRQVDDLQRSIDALASLDRAVVVTTGPSVAPSELVAAANTIVVAEVPHHRILDRADVVVTHAGHGTVVSALAHGVPLVCMPMGRDQHDVTRRVLATGCGLAVDPATAGTELLPAVRQVIGDPAFTRRAAALADAIHRHEGVEEAIGIIERAATAR